MTETRDPVAAPALLVVAAFAAVYVIWGSTYLGIRFAIETIPPFLMAAARWLVAGSILFAWARARGAPRPTASNWLATAIVGTLLVAGGNGVVSWAEQYVSSGLAALLVATVPLWMVVFDWLRPGGVRPRAAVGVGIAIGLLGVALLAGPGAILSPERVRPVGVLAVLAAAVSWAWGSIYSRRADVPSNATLSSSMGMLAGGSVLLVASLARGETASLEISAVSTKSLLALAYLTFLGSIVGFSAYMWLLRVTTPARVATYAFVNPIVAVFLGWGLAGERVTSATLLAAALIVTGVAIIVLRRQSREPPGGREHRAGGTRSRLR